MFVTTTPSPMSVCKFDQRGSCKFGGSCKNVHQPVPITRQDKPITLAHCIFFARRQCIKGDTCNFAHLLGNEPQPPDATIPDIANLQVNRCRYWSSGTCNKGDACSFIHSEIAIPPTSNEGSTPAGLTSHTTTDSDEVREIVNLDVQTAQSEIHVLDRSSDPEGVKQLPVDDSQESLANSTLHLSPKLIPLPLEPDPNICIHTPPTSSDETRGMKNPQAEANTADPYVELVYSSHSLEGIDEDTQKEALLEDDMRVAPSSAPTNNTSKEYGEEDKLASADGKPHGLHHSESSSEDISFQDGMPQPAFRSACGTDQSHEEYLLTEMVDNSLIQQSPSSLETEQGVPEFMQNSMAAPQSGLPYEQNSQMEGASPEVPETVPHWSQYADPLADPSTPLCKFFVQSRCHHGDACSFRHSITVNEYALLFRDPQPPLWSSRAQLQRAKHAIPSTVSAFGICKFYPLGTCHNGDRCPYLHTPPLISTAAASEPEEGWAGYSEPRMSPYRKREVRPCKYYAENGYCKRGEGCQFSHEVDGQNGQNDGLTEWQNNGNTEYAAQHTRPCKYFSEGHCKKGDQCTFLHDNANSDQKDGDGLGETTSNGWGETADGWGAPNADGWDAQQADGWVEQQADGWVEQKADSWGEPIMNSSDKKDGDSDGRTSMSPVDGTEKQYHHRAENDAPACGSWGEHIEILHGVTSEADMDCHDSVRMETPPKGSWGDQTETLWDNPVSADHSQAARSRDDSLEQTKESWNDVPTSNIHKWASTVADESKVVESHHPDDDDEKTWSTPWSDNVAEFNSPVRYHAPCKAFGQGYCSEGDACPYQHFAPPDPVMESQRLARAKISGTDMHEDLEDAEAQSDSDTEIAHFSVERNMFNCTMCFGSGCFPTNILTACDSTRVLLSNISPTITEDDLRDIAHTFGDISRLVIDLGEMSANAAIEFGDQTGAVNAIAHLDGQTYGLMSIKAKLDTVAAEQTMRPLISRTIKLSWPSPMLSAWAFYPTITIAKAQEKRLDGQTYNDRKIKAEFHRPRPKQTHSFAVKITGLPTKTSKKSLEQLCEESTLVTLENITYDSTPVNNALHDLLANLGPLDSFDVPSWDENQSKILGFAQFHMDMTPLDRVKALNAVPQPFLGGGSLSIQHVFHAKYSLSVRQFDAVHNEIDRLGTVHKTHGSIHSYPNPDQNKVVLHVYGESKDPEKFGRFNIELQALLQGEILMSEGKRMWDEYFGISSSVKALEKINADNPFFIQVDNRIQTIHVSGSESNRRAARVIVLRLLKKVRARRCVIPLGKSSVHGLLTGGYQALQDDVGLNKVSLDVVASELIIWGDSDVVRQVRLALDTHSPSSSSNGSSGPALLKEESSCPVCYQNPTNSIKLFCRHVYCRTCLQYVLRSLNGLRFIPPKCIAAAVNEDEGQQCAEKIPYTIVRDLLRIDQEEQLLKASFLYHVRNHPDEYFFCPTPNCETVYGHGREGRVYRCPSCFTQICSSCHLQYHEGLTCSERCKILEITSF